MYSYNIFVFQTHIVLYVTFPSLYLTFPHTSKAEEIEKKERQTERRMASSLSSSLFYLSLVLLLLLVLVEGQEDKKKDNNDYGLVIDLGSKGSRVSIFVWPSDSDAPYPLLFLSLFYILFSSTWFRARTLVYPIIYMIHIIRQHSYIHYSWTTL